MVDVSNLIKFSGSLDVGDWLYSARPLSAPSYLPLNDDTASYLTSSYPALSAIYAPTTVAYSTTTKTIPYIDSNYSFLFGNKTFLGWTPKGNIITSIDNGNTWLRSAINTDYVSPSISGNNSFPTLVSSTYSNPWEQMVYGNGKFVAVRKGPVLGGATNTGAAAVSIGATAVSNDNGQTWIQGSVPNSQWYWSGGAQYQTIQYKWNTIGYNGSRFFIIGSSYDGTNYYRVSSYSPDGIEWSNPAQAAMASSVAFFTNMALGTSTLLSIQGEGAATSTVVGSTITNANLTLFTISGLPTSQYWKSIAFGNGVFVVVGASEINQNTTVAYTSPSGTGGTWTARTMPASLSWQSVTFANGYFVAVGQDVTGVSNTNNIATSTDGITWTLRAAPTAVTSRGVIAGGNGKFIYQDIGTSTIGIISLSTSATSFTLPMVTPMKAVTAYMRAT